MFMESTVNKYMMAHQQISAFKFANFPDMHYIAYVTFRQLSRSCGSIEQGKFFFSGTHQLYGLKTEILGLIIRLAIECIKFYPGSVNNKQILWKNILWHDKLLMKKESKHNFNEIALETNYLLKSFSNCRKEKSSY